MNHTNTSSGIIISVMERSDKLLKGKTLRISVSEMLPYLEIEKDSENRIVNISGYLADLWKILESEFDFKSTYMDSGPELLGSNENGTWNGMIGDLQSKRADVGLGTFGMTKERLKVVDFSAAIAYDASKFLMYSTGNSQLIDWKTYLTTLSWEIWSCTVVLWILTSVILTCVTRSDANTSNFDYFFYLLGAIASQGCEVSPKKAQGRIIFITFWFMCVVLNTSFTALLTTNLTTAKYKPLMTMDEALSKGFRVSVAKGTQQHQMIMESDQHEPAIKLISDMIKQDPTLVVTSDEDGIATTLDGKTLYVSDSTILIYLTSNNCSFKLQAPILLDGYLHLAYRKNLRYREPLDRRILRLMASGVIKKLAIKWLYKSVNCEESREEVPSLGLNKTMFAFSLIASGTMLSLVLLLLERVVFSVRTEKIRKSAKDREQKLMKFRQLVQEYMQNSNSNSN